MRFTRTRVLLVALAAPVAMIAATTAPASAASAGVAVVTGSGIILPGLTAVPTAQTFNFSGNAAVTGVINGSAEVNVNHPASAAGNDLAGSYAAGAGPLTVNISGLPSMSGFFLRIGAVVAVAVTGPTASVGAGVCGFLAQEIPPATVQHYSVDCASFAVQVP